MNSLSWMIYLAEVAGRAADMFGAASFLFGLFGGVCCWFLAAFLVIEEGKKALPIAIVCVWFVVETVFVAGSVLIPSSSTIYMIAASEAGETVVTSPEAKEMLGDLKEIIRRRLKEELKGEIGA